MRHLKEIRENDGGNNVPDPHQAYDFLVSGWDTWNSTCTHCPQKQNYSQATTRPEGQELWRFLPTSGLWVRLCNRALVLCWSLSTKLLIKLWFFFLFFLFELCLLLLRSSVLSSSPSLLACQTYASCCPQLASQCPARPWSPLGPGIPWVPRIHSKCSQHAFKNKTIKPKALAMSYRISQEVL